MKKTLILVGILAVGYANAQTDPAYNHRVGINTATPRASLEVKATAFDQRTQGILFPHISNEEKKKWQPNETTGLVAGTVIWNENLKCLDYFDGEKWQCTDGTNPYYPPVNTTPDKTIKADVWDRYHYIGSFNHSGANIDGVLDNDTNKLKLQIPYNRATLNGNYNEINVKRTVKDRNGKNVLLTLHIPKGKFTQAKGFLEGTIIVGSGATTDTFSVKQLDVFAEEILTTFTFSINGNVSNVNLIASGGVLDKNFGKTNYNLIYVPVSAYTDHVVRLPHSGPHYEKKWLNNNLGANYANRDIPAVFNPIQQADSPTDYNAYGSLFQWQRPADGHELIEWANATTINKMSDVVDSPLGDSNWIASHSNFIRDIFEPHTWVDDTTRTSITNKDLWQAGGANNPCPTGFHVPTNSEWNLLRVALASEDISFWTGSNPLKMSLGSYRSGNDYNPGKYIRQEFGYYWASSQSSLYYNEPISYQVRPNFEGVVTSTFPSTTGLSIRCVAD